MKKYDVITFGRSSIDLYSQNIGAPFNDIQGFDDEPHSKYFTPALSTVWQPVYSIGILAAKILLKQLQAETLEPPFRKEIFTPELLIRASSKKI